MKLQKKTFFIILSSLILSSSALFSETVQKTAEHLKEKAPTILDILLRPRFITKFAVMLVLGLAAFALLKTKKMNKGIKIVLLLIATFLFGFMGNLTTYFIMHPSPICAATKSILYGFGIPLIMTLAVIFLLTLIGPKLFCGWVCPVGAIQELIAMLSDKLGIKRCKTSFTIAQTVRLFIFLLFIFISATKILNIVVNGNVYALSLYDYINPFHGMEIGPDENLFGYMTHYLPFLLTVILAFKYYRPYCHFVCPVGLYTHWLEQIAVFRIRFKKESCTNCNACVKNTPCTTVPEIMKESILRPDCFACNECIRSCPENSLDIGIKRSLK
jgi:polyferredoxin